MPIIKDHYWDNVEVHVPDINRDNCNKQTPRKRDYTSMFETKIFLSIDEVTKFRMHPNLGKIKIVAPTYRSPYNELYILRKHTPRWAVYEQHFDNVAERHYTNGQCIIFRIFVRKYYIPNDELIQYEEFIIAPYYLCSGTNALNSALSKIMYLEKNSWRDFSMRDNGDENHLFPKQLNSDKTIKQ